MRLVACRRVVSGQGFTPHAACPVEHTLRLPRAQDEFLDYSNAYQLREQMAKEK